MKLIIYFLLLMIAAWGGVLLRQDSGIVLLSFSDCSVEMPIWLAVAAFFLLVSMILLVMFLINGLLAGYYHSKHYIQTSKKKIARQRTTQALLQLAQSQWSLAEHNAIKGAAFSDLPFINYVSAAKAAQEQQAWNRRDKYLALAANNVHVSESKLSAGIIKAKLQYKQGDIEQSLVTLQELRNISPKHPLVLRLLAELYASSKNWSSLLQLLPALKKHKSCPTYVLLELSEKTYQGLLIDQMHQYGKQELIRFWQEIPKAVKCNTKVIETYVSCLYKLEAYKEAGDILKNALCKHWDKKLVRLYGFLQIPNLSKHVFIAEEWLKIHPGDPTLLMALARLCLRQQLWGKARDYLEMSIQLESNPEAYAELGRLLGYLGETEKCQDCYRKGLFAVTDILNLEQ